MPATTPKLTTAAAIVAALAAHDGADDPEALFKLCEAARSLQARKAAKTEPVTAHKVTPAERLYDALVAATRTQREHPGPAPLVSNARMVVAPNLRRFRSARGTAIVMPEVISVPDARYWPGGALPEGLTPVPQATGADAGRLDWLNAQNARARAAFDAAQIRKDGEREAARIAEKVRWAERQAEYVRAQQEKLKADRVAIDRLQAEHAAWLAEHGAPEAA